MRRLISLVSSHDTFLSQLITQKILSEQKFCAHALVAGVVCSWLELHAIECENFRFFIAAKIVTELLYR